MTINIEIKCAQLPCAIVAKVFFQYFLKRIELKRVKRIFITITP